MINDWVLEIKSVPINSQYPATVQLEISPCEKMLMDVGIISEYTLRVVYTEAILRGSFTHYTVTGG